MSQSDRVGHSKNTPKACIIEIDYVGLDGIRRQYDALVERLAKEKVKLDPGLFGRFLLGAHLEHGLNRLFNNQQKSGMPTAEIATSVQASMAAALLSAAPRPAPEIVALMKELAGQGVKVGLLTQLPEADAQAAFAPLLEGGAITVLPESHALVGGFGLDAWRRAVRKLQMVDRLGVAVVGSANSNRAALGAGLFSVAIASELTEHQDYGGADHIGESFDDKARAALLNVLRMKG